MELHSQLFGLRSSIAGESCRPRYQFEDMIGRPEERRNPSPMLMSTGSCQSATSKRDRDQGLEGLFGPQPPWFVRPSFCTLPLDECNRCVRMGRPSGDEQPRSVIPFAAARSGRAHVGQVALCMYQV